MHSVRCDPPTDCRCAGVPARRSVCAGQRVTNTAMPTKGPPPRQGLGEHIYRQNTTGEDVQQRRNTARGRARELAGARGGRGRSA